MSILGQHGQVILEYPSWHSCGVASSGLAARYPSCTGVQNDPEVLQLVFLEPAQKIVKMRKLHPALAVKDSKSYRASLGHKSRFSY